MVGKSIKKLLAVMITTVMVPTFLTGCLVSDSDPDEVPKGSIRISDYATDITITAPFVFGSEDGRYYYMYGSGNESAFGEEVPLSEWKQMQEGYSVEGATTIISPTIVYSVRMGRYLMYYSTVDSNNISKICMATAKNPEGPWKFDKVILSSGFSSKNYTSTDFVEVMGKKGKVKDYLTKSGKYNSKKWPKCACPRVLYDQDKRMWMVYGSGAGGIFLLEIDSKSGEVIHPKKNSKKKTDRYFGTKLAGGSNREMEEPFIMYSKETKYYYLFLSYGEQSRDGGYQIRMLRSEKIKGPYLDALDKTPDGSAQFSDCGVKLAGNYTFPSIETAYLSPGGASVFYGNDSKPYIVYQQRLNDGGEDVHPRIHRLYPTSTGWLTMAPFNSNGTEEAKRGGYTAKDLRGKYFLLNHGLSLDSSVNKPREAKFRSDGDISGDYRGSFTIKKGTNRITIVIQNHTYTGVIFDMKDEADNQVRCISAVGDDNTTFWGIHYMKDIKEDNNNNNK